MRSRIPEMDRGVAEAECSFIKCGFRFIDNTQLIIRAGSTLIVVEREQIV